MVDEARASRDTLLAIALCSSSRISLGHQGDIVAEKLQREALERMLKEEKDLMDSALRREMGKAADLQVELTTARQQRASLLPI